LAYAALAFESEGAAATVAYERAELGIEHRELAFASDAVRRRHRAVERLRGGEREHDTRPVGELGDRRAGVTRTACGVGAREAVDERAYGTIGLFAEDFARDHTEGVEIARSGRCRAFEELGGAVAARTPA